MISTSFIILPIVFFVDLAVGQSLNVVCVAGQCLQGFSNTTFGATLSVPGATTSLHLLPGTYTSTTNPQLLHNLLVSSSASLAPSPGFENATQNFKPSSLPLELSMSPGMTVYSDIRYSGQGIYSGFTETPRNADAPPTVISAASFVLSDNVFAILGGSNNGSEQIILWDSVPDTAQLPLLSGSPTTLNILDISSTTCNPTCSSNGVCSPTTNTCVCPSGFTGTSCESCSPGFFGPKCQACPAGCDQCDEGTQGTGRCLKKTVVGNPESCGCVNGQCGNSGQCTCNAGWKDGSDGKKCSTCQDGFFLTSTGECQVCQAGCSKCVDTTGSCIQCTQGFSIDATDNTKCDVVKTPTSSGQICPDGSFNNGTQCSPCSVACESCNGTTSNNCLVCAAGAFMLNGSCVSTNTDGVCESTTNMIANNFKGECDSCPSKCTSCEIPGFNRASTIDQAQCTGCLPGFVLSQGRCVESCPAGTFLSPQDNLNCIPCDSSCSTCADSADFCLACSGSGQLAFGGKCVSSCPPNTFTTNSSSCVTCHDDCASCSGPQFNQCTSCPTSRPNLKDGRCLVTCAQGEFFDNASSSCQGCDSSCSTCSASGDDKCLSCADGEVLRQGKCVESDGGCVTLKGFGVCLNELVVTPTGTSGPMPSISGISEPIKVQNKLQWWQILLMVLGCLFLGMIVVVLWHRRAWKKRAARTQTWATQKGIPSGNGGPWWKRMFARKARGAYSTRMGKGDQLPRYRDEVISKVPGLTTDWYIDAYDDKRSSWEYSSRSNFESRSLFSEITGELRKAPEPRVPVKEYSPFAKSLPTRESFTTRRTTCSKTSGKNPVDDEAEAEQFPEEKIQEQVGEHPGVTPLLASESLTYGVTDHNPPCSLYPMVSTSQQLTTSQTTFHPLIIPSILLFLASVLSL